MNRTKYFFFILILLTSCIQSFIVPTKIKKRFTFCYDGKPTGLESKININGFYEMTDIWWNESGYGKTYNPRWDTTQIDILFFNDGICALGFGWHSYNQTGKQYLDSLAKTPNHLEINASQKGVYRVFGDTIKVQVINDVRWAAPTWMAHEVWYKIVDRNTLKRLGSKALHNEKVEDMEIERTSDINTDLAHFIPVDSLPSSDIWLKKEKWFLCPD